MTDLYQSQFDEYATRGLLVDTNILLLYCAGKFDRHLIGNWKRLSTFESSDFDVLMRIVGHFKRLATTPNILTELNSFFGQLPEPTKQNCLRSLTVDIATIEEHYTSSRDLAADTHFPRFGLTDIGIAKTAKGRFLVLTDDLKLWDFLLRNDIAAFNFNHIRELSWELKPRK